MNRVTVILDRCRAATDDLRLLKARYDWALEGACDISSTPEPAGDRRPDGLHSERVADGALELAQKKEMLERRTQCKKAEEQAARRMLGRLGYVSGSVIRCYYIQRMTLAATAAKLKYSYGYVRSVRREALAKLEAMGDEEATRLMPEWYPWDEAAKALSDAASSGR